MNTEVGEEINIRGQPASFGFDLLSCPTRFIVHRSSFIVHSSSFIVKGCPQ